MTDEIERHLREKVELAGLVAKERDEVERLRAIAENAEALRRNLEDVSCRQQNEIALLRATLQALHDWNVEYARINNLFNDDGTPATFHELLEARRALKHKP